MKNKKGQLSLAEAPTIVLIVGLTFLIIATMALVAQKYGAAMPSDISGTQTNETLTTVTATGEQVSEASSQCNFKDFAVTAVYNQSNEVLLTSTNYTTDSTGHIYSRAPAQYNNTNWKVSYTYSFTGTSCNVTGALQTNLTDNTSIAGIVLTIALVGIVLSILIGVFLGFQKKKV